MDEEKQWKRDCSILYQWLVASEPWVTRSMTERDVWNFLLNRTLRFGKFTVKLIAEDFRRGMPKIGIEGISRSRDSIWRARNALRGRNMILYDLPKARWKSVEYTVNALGFKSLWDEHLARTGEIDCKAYSYVVEAIRNIKSHVAFKGGVPAVKLTDDLVTDEKKRWEANDKEKSDKRLGRPLQAAWVIDYLNGVCKDIGLPYAHEGTAKERGCINNFMKYCKLDGTDPRAILFRVAVNWLDMRQSQLRREDDTPILLPNALNFFTYFRYRREIAAWLANKENQELQGADLETSETKVEVNDGGEARKGTWDV